MPKNYCRGFCSWISNEADRLKCAAKKIFSKHGNISIGAHDKKNRTTSDLKHCTRKLNEIMQLISFRTHTCRAKF